MSTKEIVETILALGTQYNWIDNKEDLDLIVKISERLLAKDRQQLIQRIKEEVIGKLGRPHKMSECGECISFDRKFSEDGREHYRLAKVDNQFHSKVNEILKTMEEL